MHEADIISKYLVKLTNGNNISLGLQDDVAFFEGNIIITTDTTIEGTHILFDLPSYYIAYKAMARAFSDIFAKGGQAIGYFTNLILPKGFSKFVDLTQGFNDFAKKYNADLLGGDLSTHNDNKIIIVVTVVAKVTKHIPRFGAKVGDKLYITKNIGQAYIGFLDCKAGIYTTSSAIEYLKPSLYCLDSLDHINASMDISDGLIQDAEKMAKASGVCFEIDYHLLPFTKLTDDVRSMLSFGDDYNILISSDVDIPNMSLIGSVCIGNGLVLKNFPFEIKSKGYEHFTCVI